MPKHVKVSGTYQAHQIAFLYLVALGRLACEPAHLSAIFFFFWGGGWGGGKIAGPAIIMGEWDGWVRSCLVLAPSSIPGGNKKPRERMLCRLGIHMQVANSI